MTWAQVLAVFLRAAFLSANGSTTLALLEEDLVGRLHVLSRSDFALGVAVGAATPGPLGYGCIALGYLADGWRGALAATFTSWLPTLLAIPLRAFHRKVERHPLAAGANWGIAAAGGGLLLALAGGMLITDVREWRQAVFAAAALVLLFRRVHPAVVLALAAAGGAALLR